MGAELTKLCETLYLTLLDPKSHIAMCSSKAVYTSTRPCSECGSRPGGTSHVVRAIGAIGDTEAAGGVHSLRQPETVLATNIHIIAMHWKVTDGRG